jgi:Zn-dependent protease
LGLNLDITSILITLVALFLSIDVHEFAHALAAHLLGDDTAQRLGRLTLNPLAHLDPMGAIMIVVSSLLGFGIGWGKPVPFNPYKLRVDRRTGSGLVAVAGPASNLILAVLASLPIRLLPTSALPMVVWQLLVVLALINISLAIFNLLPIVPLDGHHVLIAALAAVDSGWSRRLASVWERLQRAGPSLLILIIIANSYIGILDAILSPPARALRGWIMGPAWS